jgi:geranylgeranylglycerol-phosphate geranylgeranyltransferase
MIGFAVIVGEFVSKPPAIPLLYSVLGYLTGFLICAYSMVVNDVYDVEVDRVNQPSRPLPSGKVTSRGAIRLSVVLLLAGLASSTLTRSVSALLIAGVYAFLSWLYNVRAKKAGIYGNVIVASSLAIPFIYGGVIAGGAALGSLLLIMALTSFLAGVGREVVKAIADIPGDTKRGIRSLAIAQGMGRAAAAGAILVLSAVLASWLPFFIGSANLFYTLGVVLPDLIFAYLAVSILRKPSAANAMVVKRAALLGMLIGLFVFVGGAF